MQVVLEGTPHRMLHSVWGPTSVCDSEALRDRAMPVCQEAFPGALQHTQL